MTKNEVSVSEMGLMWFKTDRKLANIPHLDLVIWEIVLGNHIFFQNHLFIYKELVLSGLNQINPKCVCEKDVVETKQPPTTTSYIIYLHVCLIQNWETNATTLHKNARTHTHHKFQTIYVFHLTVFNCFVLLVRQTMIAL